MFLRVLVAASALALAQTAAAQPLFGNPLADAAAYRTERGETDEARFRARYEVTRIERGGAPIVSELVIDVANDWSLTREGEIVVLRDFRLNRVFTIGGGHFTTMNGLADLTFRVMERQNRSYLQRITDLATNRSELPDACDAESELGIVIPGADGGATELRERREIVTLRCNERDIGSLTPGDGPAPPAAFWPTMYAAMTTHPALHRRARETGRAPGRLETSHREVGGAVSRSWRLVAVETVSVAYPLDAASRNVTAEALDQLVADAGQVGAEAVAGRALGGAPTLESWTAHLREVSRREGPAAAAMLLTPTFNMFPEIECSGPQQHMTCDMVRNLRSLGDPAALAVMEIAIAEQQNDLAGAIAAMQRAQRSPHGGHATLGASFALAVQRFNQEQLAQARAANAPTDVAALQNRALLAFPYNPAYWTDVGDRFAREYEWPSAFLFYDVAYALPMPSAVARNRALATKRQQIERIRRDFPDAWLAV